MVVQNQELPDNFALFLDHTALIIIYCMQRFACPHSSIDCIRFGVGRCIPTLLDMRRSWIECIISLIIERNSFQSIFSLLNIGARSDFIISEEDRAIGFSLGIFVRVMNTSTLQKRPGSDIVGRLLRIESTLHQQNYYWQSSLNCIIQMKIYFYLKVT